MKAKQSIKAVYALLVMLILTAGIMSLVEYTFLETWLAFFFILCVPVQVAIGELLIEQKPSFLISLPQPYKGLCIVVISAILGIGYTLLSFYTVGGGLNAPGPPLIAYSIVVVVTTFWFVIVWRCWPISVFTQNVYLRCIAILTLPFIIGYLVYTALFNFSFLQGTPLYQPSLDPNGLFTSWNVTAFLVTTVALLFSLVLFEFRLFSRFMNRPLMWGISNTALILFMASFIYLISVKLAGIDPVVYLINGPITYIFGVFIPLNLFGGALFQNVKQPKKGVYLMIISIISGLILNILYKLFAAYFGPDVSNEVSNSYALELWMANAMLAFSFPILVALTDHFKFWPLKN